MVEQQNQQAALKTSTVIGGKYRILELLGRGGMGTVYLAEQAIENRKKTSASGSSCRRRKN